MGKWFDVWGVVVSITLTVLDFAIHSDTCKYGINPVCFFWCLKWAFLGLMWWIGCSMPDDK